jgi:hypothetical protein
MQLEITRKVEKKEIIEINFPYYYRYDLLLDEADVVIYGKIEEKKHTSIKITKQRLGWCGNEFELHIEKREASTLSRYMNKEYKSNEAEYLAKKTELLNAAQDA